MKIVKTETEGELAVERRHHARHYMLVVDKDTCVGCEVCSLICPREAITVEEQPAKEGEKAEKPRIQVDEAKCHYCGICDVICPFGAVTVKVDGKPFVSVVDKESFPQLSRDIQVDTSKCDVGCVDCEEACPVNLIKVSVKTTDGRTIRPEEAKKLGSPEGLKVELNVKEEGCPACMLCEAKCPEGAVSVKRIFFGTLKINWEKCPEGCRVCLDVCPIEGALYMREDGKVGVDERFCVYCGACRVACPEEGALELNRTSISHKPVSSGAWNKALEKLASTAEMTKELKSKGMSKARETVEKRLKWRKK